MQALLRDWGLTSDHVDDVVGLWITLRSNNEVVKVLLPTKSERVAAAKITDDDEARRLAAAKKPPRAPMNIKVRATASRCHAVATPQRRCEPHSTLLVAGSHRRRSPRYAPLPPRT